MEAKADNTVMLEDFGVMTEEWNEETPTYNLKELFDYCRRVSKRPVELTNLEREQFRTN